MITLQIVLGISNDNEFISKIMPKSFIMKNYILLFFLFAFSFTNAQIPDGYYDDADGLTGYALKTKLHEITEEDHISNSYGSLWEFFNTYDIDIYYDNDDTILDIYTENPDGEDPHNFTPSTDQCGNYTQEGDCYNREHMMPQSWFDKGMPMRTDIHHIYPVDGYVNAKHSNHPLGEVNNPTYTSGTGNKVGNNDYDFDGAYTGTVFEPIDEFKGDIARAYLYMVTRYEDKVADWQNNNTGSQNSFNGTSDQGFNDWTLDMLLKWHEEDPVSQKELDRNENAMEYQGNRNPFIDHPEYVEEIWGTSENGDGPADPDEDEVVFEEDFDNCESQESFIAVSEMSDADWECTTYGENNTGAMQMNAFVDGNQTPSKDWLITAEAIDFEEYENLELNFYTQATFGETELKLMYSTNYDGSENPSDFEWEEIPNVDIPLYDEDLDGAPEEINHEEIDISDLSGEQVYIAFYYDNTDGEAATRWTVDSFKITSNDNLEVERYDKFKVSLYPNPVKYGDVTIELPEAEEFSYELFDMSGKLVAKNSIKSNRTKVSTQDLSEGVYLLKVKNKQQTETKKLVVK